MKRVRVVISGDVQGVGFRAWAQRQAKNLQFVGWIRNRKDKTVELLAEGEKKQLEELVKRCQHGPDVAWVEKVDVAWVDATGEFVDFQVVY